MKIPLAAFFLLLGLQSSVSAETANDELLSGLWSYNKISHGGETALDNTGLFLFHNGRFFQQTIDGDMGQAHAGSYRVAGDTVSFDVEMGILVSGSADPTMSVRLNAGNQATISYRDKVLTLGFDEGTVQTLTKHAEVENAKVQTVTGGYLVFTEDSFIYMSLEDDKLEAGSGSYTKTAEGYSLQANPWISVAGKRVTYSYNENIELSREKKVFSFSDGRKLDLKMTAEQDE
jgi:hypothetical protein